MRTSCQWPPKELFLRVLGYKEGKKWVAHCLELDLVGEGPSFPKACEHLHELIEMQVSFAVFKGTPKLLYHPAPSEYFVWFERVQREALESFPKTQRGKSERIANVPLRVPKAPPPGFVPTYA